MLKNAELTQIAINNMQHYHYFNNYDHLIVYAKQIMDELKADKPTTLTHEEKIAAYMQAYVCYIDALRLRGEDGFVFRFFNLDGKYGEASYRVENVFQDIPEDLLKIHKLKVDLLNIRISMDMGYWRQADLLMEPLLSEVLNKTYPCNNFEKSSLPSMNLLETQVITLNTLIQFKMNNLEKLQPMLENCNDLLKFYVKRKDFTYPQESYDLLFDLLYIKILIMKKMQKNKTEIKAMYDDFQRTFMFNPDLFSTEQSGFSFYLKYLVSELKAEKSECLDFSLTYYRCTKIPRNIVLMEYFKAYDAKEDNKNNISDVLMKLKREKVIDHLTYIPDLPSDIDKMLHSMFVLRPAII